jgi:hypothetical protein
MVTMLSAIYYLLELIPNSPKSFHNFNQIQRKSILVKLLTIAPASVSEILMTRLRVSGCAGWRGRKASSVSVAV